jgi:hypothetical protein
MGGSKKAIIRGTDSFSVPECRHAVPERWHAMPERWNAVPEGWHAVPEGWHAVLSHTRRGQPAFVKITFYSYGYVYYFFEIK